MKWIKVFATLAIFAGAGGAAFLLGAIYALCNGLF